MMPRRRAAGVADESVRLLLKRWLPNRAIVFARAGAGGSTPVYRVVDTATNDAFFLRLAEEAGESRAAEARVHELLRAAGLPVPEVLVWEELPPELDRSAMLTSRVPGRPMREFSRLAPAMRHAAARAAGRDLARINSVPVRGFGWVRTVLAADGALAAEHPTRSAWTAEYPAAAAIAAAGLLAATALDQLQLSLDHWLRRPDQTTSALTHGDFDATHVYLHEPSLTYSGIIDFGESRGADPLYDLGHALLHDTQPDRRPIFPSLLAGYQAVAPVAGDALTEIQLQAIAIGVRRLAIAHRRASPSTGWLANRLTTFLTTPAEALASPWDTDG